MKTHRRVLATALLATVLAGGFGAAPAAAAPPTVKLGNFTLVAKGVQVKGIINITCDLFRTYTVYGTLSQRVQKQVINGASGAYYGTCTTEKQRIVANFVPQGFPPLPFKAGVALANVTVETQNPDGTTNPRKTVNREVTIQK